MSLVEKDPILGWLWDQPALAVACLMVFAVWILWAIKALRANLDHKYPPYGLTIFKWITNFIGDLFCLTAAVTGIAVYYSKERVEPSVLSSTWFFLISAALGLASAARFILKENQDPEGYGNPDVTKFNWERAYHFFYFALNVYIFLGFLRSFLYWEHLGLMALVVMLYLGWFVTGYVDGRMKATGGNPIWRFVVRKTGKSKYL